MINEEWRNRKKSEEINRKESERIGRYQKKSEGELFIYGLLGATFGRVYGLVFFIPLGYTKTLLLPFEPISKALASVSEAPTGLQPWRKPFQPFEALPILVLINCQC